MADFRITISNTDGDLALLGENILAAHGDEWDAARGDFATSVEGGQLLIDVREVGGGDIDALANEIMEQETDLLGASYDIRVSQKVGDNYFARDEGDDLIEA